MSAEKEPKEAPRGRWSGINAAVQQGHLQQKERPQAPTYHAGPNGEIVDSKGNAVPDPFTEQPCEKAKEATYACLSKGGDPSQCQEFFDAYNLCKRQWNDRKKSYRELSAKLDREELWDSIKSIFGK
eukprot:m.45502 g.45502  ORF g.45502 m.45502 type:complete len:127 (-) comp10253_c0_seq1:1219-1599(-)